MKNALYFLIATTLLSCSSDDRPEDILDFPDPNFKTALLEGWASSGSEYSPIYTVDANNDGEISKNEAKAVRKLKISGFEINSMEGIEHFTKLSSLDCSNNNLTHLDLSENKKLEYLHFDNNRIREMDISQNQDLRLLRGDHNQLLYLRVSTNVDLQELSIAGNQIEYLDVSKNRKLLRLTCSQNQLRILDLSLNEGLLTLTCNDNQLTYLNLKSGNNQFLARIEVQGNQDLVCIQVDDAQYSTINEHWQKDDTAVYSEDCEN